MTQSPLWVLVLSDGQAEKVRPTAESVESFAHGVIVLERSPAAGPPAWRPDGRCPVRWLHLDWTDDTAVADLLDSLTGWCLVLGAGERARGDLADWSTLLREGRDHASIRVDDRSEVRLAAASSQAQSLIGTSAAPDERNIWITGRDEPTTYPAGPLRNSLALLQEAVAGHDVGFSELVESVERIDEAAAELLRDAAEVAYYRSVLRRVRDGRDVCWADETEPLVTIRIPTYNRGDAIQRAVESALAQSYERVEVLIIGDRCDEATATAASRFRDPRVRFVDLGYRYPYPPDGKDRWYVAGTEAVNAALTLARGSWIAPCDDDDELTADHIELLLTEATERRLEFVWSVTRFEQAPGVWGVFGEEPLRCSKIAHGSVLYSAGLRFFRYSPSSFRLDEPGDWNMWKRMHAAGVHMGFVNAVTYIHHLDTNRRNGAAA